jgi:MFS family permease
MTPAAALSQQPFNLRSLTFSVYLPTLLFAIGQGAVLPVIPLFAKDLGASAAAASLVFAMRGIGTMALDLPGGLVVSRYGDKGAMLAGTALVAIVALGASTSPSPFVLGLLILVMGGAWAFWQLARLAYVSEVTPIEQRGRALSLVGGMNRTGNFIGPVIGGFMGRELGLESVFYVQAVAGLAAAALMFVSVRSSGSETITAHGLGRRLASTVVDNRRVFLATAFPVVALGILRQARQVFIPLWGDSIGLDVAQIGLVAGASTFVDAMIFYPVGLIMDRNGRKWAAVPCLGILAAGFLILPATNDITGFVAVAMLTGFGNGLGAGIVMTLGADYAPPNRRGEFLGVWRLIADAGAGGGPLVVSFFIGLASLAAASIACGAIGLAGALIMAVFVPETLRRAAPDKSSLEF